MHILLVYDYTVTIDIYADIIYKRDFSLKSIERAMYYQRMKALSRELEQDLDQLQCGIKVHHSVTTFIGGLACGNALFCYNER
jgi:hypothetical protein